MENFRNFWKDILYEVWSMLLVQNGFFFFNDLSNIIFMAFLLFEKALYW